MPYYGHTLMLREVLDLAAPHWPNSKVKAIATAGAEAKGSIGALHDNKKVITFFEAGAQVCNVETYELVTVVDPARGQIKLSDGSIVGVPTVTEWIWSRDCGLYQISIPARLINSPYEFTIRTESLDLETYMPVAKANVQAAYDLWNNPWVRDGKEDFRRWQPWVAYNSGWAMYPEAWAWHHDENKNPVGPWVKTGRFLHNAIRAVANWHLYIAKDMNEKEALEEAERLAGYWVTRHGELKYSSRNGIYWVYSPAPTTPPTAEPWGYPVPNNGF